MGEVEKGVYTSFKSLGIDEPTTVFECLAVCLARSIDSAKYSKDLPPLAARLTEVMDRVAAQPTPEKDDVAEMADRY
jgi:hypothetical protein